MKKNIYLIFILLTALVTALLLAPGFFRFPFLDIDPLEAIPADSYLIFEMDTKKLSAPETVFFDETIRKNWEEISAFLPKNIKNSDQKAVISVQAESAGKWNCLFILENSDKTDLSKALARYDSLKINHAVYRGQTVSSVRRDEQPVFSFSAYRNLLLIGQYDYMVENAVRALLNVQTNLLHDNEFQKIHKNLAKSRGAKFYLNSRQLPDFFESDKQAAVIFPYRSFAKWAGFGISGCQSDGCDLEINFLEKSHFSSRDASPDVGAFAGLAPDNTALLIQTSVDRKNFSKKNDFGRYFLPWTGSSAAMILVEPFNTALSDDLLFFIEVGDEKLAREKLDALAYQYGQLQSFDYQMFKVQQWMTEDLLSPLFANAGAAIRNPYGVLVGDYLVISSRRATLETWIDKYLAGQTLSKSKRYMQLAGTADGTKWFYFQPKFLLPYLQKMAAAWLPQEGKGWRKIQMGGFDFRRVGEVQRASGRLLFSKNQTTEKAPASVTIAWKTTLDTNILERPKVVRLNDGTEYGLLVQDVANQLYMIDKGGAVLWKKKMDGPIFSEFYELNIFKDQSRQFLFNTANHIYILDESGSDVTTFPIRLQNPATNGLMMIDFDGSGSYNFFLAAENGGIYGFDTKGRPLPGWNPRTGVGDIRHPLKHFQQDGKDYLVALAGERTVHCFQRDGSVRFPPIVLEGKLPFSMPAVQSYPGAGRIVLCDDGGTATVINTEGSSFKLLLKAAGTTGIRFSFADFSGDDRNDYLVAGDSEAVLYGYDEKNDFKKWQSIKLPEQVEKVFAVKVLQSPKKFFGALSENKKWLYLFDTSGKLVSDFPLAGSTAFSIKDWFDDGKPALITGLENSVYIYRLE